MAERTDELREDIERRRQRITHTVDEIQNRVSPYRMSARGRYRVRRWFIDVRDRMIGNDQTHYPWEGESQGAPAAGEGMGQRVSEGMEEMSHRASEAVSGASERLAQTPTRMRQQTQGNPLVAGLIAFGGGMLIASLLPETDTERRARQEIEPALSGAAERAGEMGRHLTEEMKEDAREAMEEVKHTVAGTGEELKQEAEESMQRVRGENQT